MLNKAILVGRLTRDPELRSTATGVSVVNFTVAIQRRFKDANGERQSDFINCVAFNRTADFVKTYFAKGNMISCDGYIQTRTWDDNDGKRHFVTEVVVNDAGFVESKRDSAPRKENEAAPDMPDEFGVDGTDDDLPF